MSASNPPDDLDALRAVIEAVKHFDQEDQKRIFRWAGEKLGLPPLFTTPPVKPPQQHHAPPTQNPPSVPPKAPTVPDIKSFVTQKNPPNDVQFAATVAYYYQFEAHAAERKDSINGDDLQEACRLAGRARLPKPSQTLINAQNYGLLDKAGERGYYSVNTVGENLVAMTLPGDGTVSNGSKRPRKKAAKKKATKKKGATKKAGKKA